MTVKVRKGIDDRLLTYLDAGRVAEAEGAAAIGLHARTAAQLYAGEADWDAIAALKAAVSIPVLGNGDVWECWDALRMLRATGCDGVIVGRGCLRRPWLFAELAAVFDGREPAPQPRFGRDRGAHAPSRRDARRLLRPAERHAPDAQVVRLVHHRLPQLGGRCAPRWSRIDAARRCSPILARLDPDEPFPTATVRANRVKDARVQRRVTLPAGYLADRDDDTPPSPPFDPRERAAFERALDGG